MKKFYKITVLVLIFCLCFSTAVFGDVSGVGTDEENQAKVFRCGHLPFAPGDEFKLVTLDDVAWRSGEYSGTSTVEKIPSKFPHFDTPKEIPLVVLVLEFNNISYKDDYDWTKTIFQGEYSLAQYYKDMSFNQFAFVPAKETSAYNVGGNHNKKDKANDGVVHITVDADHGCWDLSDDDEDAKWISCLVEGVNKADDYVDFSTFDKNQDGEITTDEMALAVVVAGYEAAFDGDLTEGENYYLWSHAWSIYGGWYWYFSEEYPYPEDFVPCPDGVYVSSYIAIPEQLEKDHQEPISVLAHELGHYLGLPDLYDTDYGSGTWSTYDVSYLSVMCSGSWGWNSTLQDYLPVAFDAWSRCCLGWVLPETVAIGTHDVVSDKGSEYNVLRVETGVDGDYYLLENREISSWDQGLDVYKNYASNGGLVCWHIDDEVYDNYAQNNSVNNSGHRPAVMPLYPESDSSYNPTFIGTLKRDGLNRPFFTYDIWNSYYSGTLNCVDFPTYNKSNTYSDRTFSGVQMRFLQAPNSHTVRITFGECTHDLVATPAKAATCTEAGNSAYWTCSICGCFFSDAEGKTQIEKDSWVIPAKGHKLTATEAHDATCTEAGNSAYWTCTVCGKFFSDSKGKNEIAKNSWVIPAKGHTPGEAVKENVVKATCTTKGSYDEVVYCTVCGAELSREKKTVAALGHAWDEGKITTEPTCTETGVKTFTCTRCGATKTETVDALGHNWDTKNVVFNWAEDFSSAEAVFTCKRDKTHTEIVDATVTSKTAHGIITYTATAVFNGATYTDQKTVEAPFEISHVRLQGDDRYDTAFLTANYMKQVEGIDKFSAVIVADGRNFADALSGSYLAAVADAPILLVHPVFEQKVFDYIKANTKSGGKVYILGGTGAVSESFEKKLKNYSVERLGGSDRFDTNVLILNAANKIDGTNMKDVLVCSGMNFADALSTSSVGKPILLVGNKITDKQKKYLKDVKADHAWIIGGTAAVNESVESELASFIKKSNTKRVAGEDRYGTSYKVAHEFYGGDHDTAVLVFGQNFPDGLSGGAVASTIDAPVLLAMNRDDMNAFATKWVKESGAVSSITLGGPDLISDKSIKSIMNQPNADIKLFK